MVISLLDFGQFLLVGYEVETSKHTSATPFGLLNHHPSYQLPTAHQSQINILRPLPAAFAAGPAATRSELGTVAVGEIAVEAGECAAGIAAAAWGCSVTLVVYLGEGEAYQSPEQLSG